MPLVTVCWCEHSWQHSQQHLHAYHALLICQNLGRKKAHSVVCSLKSSCCSLYRQLGPDGSLGKPCCGTALLNHGSSSSYQLEVILDSDQNGRLVAPMSARVVRWCHILDGTALRCCRGA